MAKKNAPVLPIEEARKLMRMADVDFYHAQLCRERGTKGYIARGYWFSGKKKRVQALVILRSIYNNKTQLDLFRI